jgi:hypothetical protein
MVDRNDGGEQRGASADGLTRGERSLLGSLASYLGFADFVAVLMVLATGFSAVATWRTATIADQIYRTSERPYLGVERVFFDSSRPADPSVVVQYQNFGHVPADGVVVSENLNLDGHPLGDGSYSRAVGVISPGVPHQIRVRIADMDRQAVMAGKALRPGSRDISRCGPSDALLLGAICILSRQRPLRRWGRVGPVRPRQGLNACPARANDWRVRGLWDGHRTTTGGKNMTLLVKRALRSGVRGLMVGATVAGALGMLTLAGCAGVAGGESTTKAAEAGAAPSAEEQQMALTFDLSKCQPMQAGLYKCPAMDQPICDASFSNPNIQCLRIGHKGSVFVQTSGGGMH